MKKLFVLLTVLSCFVAGSVSAQLKPQRTNFVETNPSSLIFSGETLLMYAVSAHDIKTIELLLSIPDLNASNIAALKSMYGEDIIKADAVIREKIRVYSEKLPELKALPQNIALPYKTAYRTRKYIQTLYDVKRRFGAITMAIIMNDTEVLNILLKKLKNVSRQEDASSDPDLFAVRWFNTTEEKEAKDPNDYFLSYINSAQTDNLSFLQYAVTQYYGSENSPEENIEVIKLLINYGARPNANPIQKKSSNSKDPIELDIVTYATLNNNAPAIKFFMEYFMSLTQSSSPSAAFTLNKYVGTKKEIQANVVKAKTLAETSCTKETIDAINEWYDLLQGKCPSDPKQTFYSHTSFAKIYNDDDALVLFSISFKTNPKSGLICDVEIGQAEEFKSGPTIEKARVKAQIQHYYSAKDHPLYNSSSHKMVYLLPTWSITTGGDVIVGQGVIKISTVLTNSPYLEVIESSDDNLRL